VNLHPRFHGERGKKKTDYRKEHQDAFSVHGAFPVVERSSPDRPDDVVLRQPELLPRPHYRPLYALSSCGSKTGRIENERLRHRLWPSYGCNGGQNIP